jgi:hypothetical protein
VGQYEKFVGEHQEYSDSYNSCVEWLNSVREKLSACSDVSGDRHAIQSRLDKIQVGGKNWTISLLASFSRRIAHFSVITQLFIGHIFIIYSQIFFVEEIQFTMCVREFLEL